MAEVFPPRTPGVPCKSFMTNYLRSLWCHLIFSKRCHFLPFSAKTVVRFRTHGFSRLTSEVANKEGYVSPVDFAIVYSGLSNADSTFEWLEIAEAKPPVPPCGFFSL